MLNSLLYSFYGNRQGWDLHDWFNINYYITQATDPYHKHWFVNHTTGRANVWRFCGDWRLRAKLPPDWKETCAPVLPFKMFTFLDFKQLTKAIKDQKNVS